MLGEELATDQGQASENEDVASAWTNHLGVGMRLGGERSSRTKNRHRERRRRTVWAEAGQAVQPTMVVREVRR